MLRRPVDRRENRRFPKRLPVRFTRRGETQANNGFTTNISSSGMFVGTASAFSLGERLRIEVLDRQHGFVVEGVVARVERVPLALRQVRQPGIGVRFLSVGELFRDLFPSAMLAGPAATTGTRAEDEKAALSASAQAAAPDGPVRVRLATLREVERVVEHDLVHGGLFIQTENPLPEGSEIEVEVEVPISGFRAPSCSARVVHRFRSAESGTQGPNLMSGMGVVFADTAPILDALRELLRRYRD